MDVSGTFVRIAPKQVSIADPEALQLIYSFSSGTTKSDLYEAFSRFGADRSVFNSVSREEHARKRRYMAHVMSAKSLSEFEPLVYKYQRMLVAHWDSMCDAGEKGLGGMKGDCVWEAKGGKVRFNCQPCESYMTVYSLLCSG